jgi:hypothetical protein
MLFTIKQRPRTAARPSAAIRALESRVAQKSSAMREHPVDDPVLSRLFRRHE